MRIIAYPYDVAAYNRSFYAELTQKGVEVVAGEFTGRWIRENINKNDIVHINWPSFYYKAKGSPKCVIKSFMRFTAILTLMQARAKALFWTGHNLFPHQRCNIPQFDILARHLVIRFANRVFVHGSQVERLLVNRFPAARNKCTQIPHGNWISEFPKVPTGEVARRQLNLPKDSYIYLMFGHGKPYKNIEGLIRAFQSVARPVDYLLIAGHFPDPDYLKKSLSLTKNDSKIRVDAKYVSDDDVPLYLASADVMCIPYREVLTSGTAMLAFSFGKPIISVSRGFLQDVNTKDTGILFDFEKPSRLASALVEARGVNWSATTIKNHAQQFTFEEAARVFLDEAEMLFRNKPTSSIGYVR